MAKNNKKTPSEADYGGRLVKVLSSIFPTFEKVEIQQEESFSINVGRRNIVITKDLPSLDNDKAKVYAIYDILLSIGDKNVILLELKKEDAQIKPEHIDQALSYGRLIHPMPPITVIAGKNVLIYDTFTREQLEGVEINEMLVNSLLEKSSDLAKADLDEAIALLLNRDPKVFSSVINAISEENFSELIGGIGDFQKPISKGFLIDRVVAHQIYEASDSQNLIGLRGAAFSGKTNILFNVFQKHKTENTAILYLDLEDLQYSIFRKLANAFSQELNFHVNEDKVLEWLNISIRKMKGFKLLFLFDNYNDDLSETIKSNIRELIDLTKSTKHCVIFSIDEINYERISKKPHRNYKTLFGGAFLLKIKNLDVREFHGACELLDEKFKASIQLGGEISKEYRVPRIIRFIANIASQIRLEDKEGKFLMFPSIPNIKLIYDVSGSLLSSALGREQRKLLKKLSKLYITYEFTWKDKNPLKLLTMAEGVLPTTLVKADLSFDEFNELVESGLVVESYVNDTFSFLVPKTPELVSYYGIEQIAVALISVRRQIDKLEEIATLFIRLCNHFQYSDIVGAGVLNVILSQNGQGLFIDLVNELLRHSYEKMEVEDGIKVKMFIPEHGYIHLDLDDIPKEERGYMLNDNLPYLILSQLLAEPLEIKNKDGAVSYDSHIKLLYRVGSYEGLLCRTEFSELNEMTEFLTHDIKDIGTIVCHKMGVIEPIIQSIASSFLKIPDEIERLYEKAIEDKNFLLLWRIYMALASFKFSAESDLAQRVNQFLNKFKSVYPEILRELLHD